MPTSAPICVFSSGRKQNDRYGCQIKRDLRSPDRPIGKSVCQWWSRPPITNAQSKFGSRSAIMRILRFEFRCKRGRSRGFKKTADIEANFPFHPGNFASGNEKCCNIPLVLRLQRFLAANQKIETSLLTKDVDLTSTKLAERHIEHCALSFLLFRLFIRRLLVWIEVMASKIKRNGLALVQAKRQCQALPAICQGFRCHAPDFTDQRLYLISFGCGNATLPK